MLYGLAVIYTIVYYHLNQSHIMYVIILCVIVYVMSHCICSCMYVQYCIFRTFALHFLGRTLMTLDTHWRYCLKEMNNLMFRMPRAPAQHNWLEHRRRRGDCCVIMTSKFNPATVDPATVGPLEPELEKNNC